MPDYNTIFFDLDHTLWDYEKNSVEALADLYKKYDLAKFDKISLPLFLTTFTKVNDKLWANFNKGHIDKDGIRQKRFFNILKTVGIKDEILSLQLSDDYTLSCPLKTNLFPYTKVVLTYLQRKYKLYILTNGFDKAQQIKMEQSKLTPFFNGVITSESSKYRKPSKEIFEFALSQASAKNSECIMIGDNLSTDIAGAHASSIDTIFFNPSKKSHKATVNHEINCLSQLMVIL